MARTTLDIADPVLRELKRRQTREKKSLGELASELLARALAETRGEAVAPAAFEWRTQDMGQPKIDLRDKDALWRALDR